MLKTNRLFSKIELRKFDLSHIMISVLVRFLSSTDNRLDKYCIGYIELYLNAIFLIILRVKLIIFLLISKSFP